MTANRWKARIKKACEAAGTYRPFFDSVINSLSVILEQRDAAMEQYEASGSKPVVAYTNKGGATNPTPNPMLVLWDKLNASALAYWKELGLTPAGLKKIDEQAMKPQKVNNLDKVLAELV